MTEPIFPGYCLLCTKACVNPDPKILSKCDLESQLLLACKTNGKKLYHKAEELFDQNNIVNFTVHIRKFCELFQLESKDTFTNDFTEFLISLTLSSKCPLCQDCQNRMKLIAKVMASIQNLQVQLIRLKIAVETDLKLNDTRLLPIPLITNTKWTSDFEIANKTRALRRCLRKKLQLDLNAEVPVGREDVTNVVDVDSDDEKFADLITINILPSVVSVDGSKQTMIQFDGVDEVNLDVNEDSEQFNVAKDEADEIEYDAEIEIEDTPAEISNDVAACLNYDDNAATPGDLVEKECAAIDNDNDKLYFEETVVTENISIIELPKEVEVALADHRYSSSFSEIETQPSNSNTKQPKKSEPSSVEKAGNLFRKCKRKLSNKHDIPCAKKRGRPQAQGTHEAVKKSKGCSKKLKGTIANLAKGESMGEDGGDQVRLGPHNTQPSEELHLPLNETSANDIDVQVEGQIDPHVSTKKPRKMWEPKGLPKPRKPLPFKCTFFDPVKGECNRRAVDQDRLDAHVHRVHKKLPRSKAYQCNECSFTNESFSRLNYHRKIHAEIKDFTCEICGMSFRSEEYLVYHKRRKHGEPFPFQCDLCNWGFNSRFKLKEHNYKNHGDGNYTHQCSVCDAGFYKKTHLEVHMAKHAVPTFQCDECHKLFKDKNGLKIHKMTHTGIRNFVCDVCDWKFYRKDKLRVHYSIHTKKRPFLCPECGFSCRLKDLLTAHLKVHENNKSLAEKGIEKAPRLAKPRNRRIKIYENTFAPSVHPTSIHKNSDEQEESWKGAETETQQVESEIARDERQFNMLND